VSDLFSFCHESGRRESGALCLSVRVRDAKALLAEASAPPIRPLSIGTGENVVKIGGETVLFRHEKTFVNKPGLAILLSDQMPEAEVSGRLQRFKELKYERVGLTLRPEMVAVKNDSNDPGKFEALVKRVKAETDAALILMTDHAGAMAAGVKACADRVPLIYAATAGNADASSPWLRRRNVLWPSEPTLWRPSASSRTN